MRYHALPSFTIHRPKSLCYTDATERLVPALNAIHQFQIGNFKNFVYLIVSGDQALVVDPQKDLRPWEDALSQRGAKLTGCLLTHSHWDHVAGVPEIARKYMVPIWVHGADAHRLAREPMPVQRALRHLSPEVPLILGDITIETIHAPGHSAGEVCFLVKGGEGPWALLTGDTVFVGDVGRCDLETGSVGEMFGTIQRLKALPGDTVIFPGHDYGPSPTSTIGRERAESAAFRCATVEELDALP